MPLTEDKISLFASCIPVKGAKKSIICDVFRMRYHPIPNALFHILNEYPNHSIQEIKERFNNEKDEFIDDYFNFLIEEEYVFFLSKQESVCFPKLDLTYNYPSTITNCIIDINESSTHDFKKIAMELSLLYTYHIELRFFSETPFENVIQMVNEISRAEFNLHLILPYISSYSKKKIQELSTLPSVSCIKFYNVKPNLIKEFEELNKYNVYFLEIASINEKSCGKTDSSYFSINVQFFSEAQSYNSCLNKKISIDTEGNIKNCPSMKEHFGNTKTTSLQTALKNKKFKKYWDITKDKITVCKDCEFRYICLDCRAYLEDPDDLHSKPLKCGYDPYTGKWEEWNKNPLKEKTIKHYEL